MVSLPKKHEEKEKKKRAKAIAKLFALLANCLSKRHPLSKFLNPLLYMNIHALSKLELCLLYLNLISHFHINSWFICCQNKKGTFQTSETVKEFTQPITEQVTTSNKTFNSLEVWNN